MQRIEFVPDRDPELFAAAPASAAVFLLRGVTVQKAQALLTQTIKD